MQHKDLIAEIIIKNITLKNHLQIYIPPSIVDRKHLTHTGKLISENKIAEIKDKIENEGPLGTTKRYSKRTLGDEFPYTAYAIPNKNNSIDIYLVYPIELTEGGSSSIHVAQNIFTGEWIVAKKKNKKLEHELPIREDNREKTDYTNIQNFSINPQHASIIKKKSNDNSIFLEENNQRRLIPRVTRSRKGLNRSVILNETQLPTNQFFSSHVDHRNSVPLPKTNFMPVNQFSEKTIILSNSISPQTSQENRLRVEDNYYPSPDFKKKNMRFSRYDDELVDDIIIEDELQKCIGGMQEIRQEIINNNKQQLKHATSIDSNFLNSIEFEIIEDEAEILKRMGKYIGGLIRQGKKQTKEIIFTPLEVELDLHDYLFSIEYLSMESALTSISNILAAYYDLYKLNIIHRDIKSENIIINPNDNFKITIIDAGSAICKIKKNKEDFHEIFHISNKICGTGAFAAPPIVRKILENATNKKKIAMELARYNPKLVSEFIQKEPYTFASKFSKALLANKGRVTLTQLINRIKKYALPIMHCSPLAAELLANTLVNEITNYFESTRELREELQTIHDAFKIGTHLKIINPELKNKLDPSNIINHNVTEDNEELLYDQKTDMYSLGRVLEDIASKIDKNANKYIKEHLITFINLCRHYKAKSRPTIAQAMRYFDNLKKYNHLITNINNTKEMETFVSQMHLDESRAFVYINANRLADFIDQNDEINFEKLKIYKNIILVLKKEMALSKAEEIKFRFNQHHLNTQNYILKALRGSSKPLLRLPTERYSQSSINVQYNPSKIIDNYSSTISGNRTLQRRKVHKKKSDQSLNGSGALRLNSLFTSEVPIAITESVLIPKEESEMKVENENGEQDLYKGKMRESFFKKRLSHRHISSKIFLKPLLKEKQSKETEIHSEEKNAEKNAEKNEHNGDERFKFFKRFKTKSKPKENTEDLKKSRRNTKERKQI